MRKITKILFIITLIVFSGCTDNESQTAKDNRVRNLGSFCKIWGFLKYYNFSISNSSVNWDSVLINNIDLVASMKNSDSLKIFFEEFVRIHTNTENNFMSFDTCNGDSIIRNNLDIEWIYDTSLFSDNTIKNLHDVYFKKCDFENKYVSFNKWVKNPIFDSDTLFNSILFPSLNIRLLALFRYWNMINYFYPYKYLTDQSWGDVLDQYIPLFIGANDTLKYHLAVCRLTAQINDNHGYTSSDIISAFMGNRFLPVKFKYIQNQTIIAEIYSDSLSILNNLQLGDIVKKIDGIEERTIRDSLSNFFSGSNELAIQHTISYYLSRSSKNKVEFLIERNNSVHEIISQTYDREIISNERKKKKKAQPYKIIEDDIVYIDLSKVNYDNVDSIFISFKDKNVLILDLRNNCKFILHNIANHIFNQQIKFYSYTTPSITIPGLYCYSLGESTGLKQSEGPKFTGNIVLLIDENTQSIGEFTTMLLLQYDKIISFGNNTAGADGNISPIFLPGMITTYITGIGIYWPNGHITQRIGIKPDIRVPNTIESIKLNNDVVFQEALNYARLLKTDSN
ncbi:MAG: hypothetical protein JXB17_01700 [Bacteroidales bacterium]|nr:hypothetical protein [Bacteroidales bacterium]